MSEKIFKSGHFSFVGGPRQIYLQPPRTLLRLSSRNARFLSTGWTLRSQSSKIHTGIKRLPALVGRSEWRAT
jgi:hypothetical protein